VKTEAKLLWLWPPT